MCGKRSGELHGHSPKEASIGGLPAALPHRWNWAMMIYNRGSVPISKPVGFINAFGVLQGYYQSDILRNESPFRISWIGSFNTFAIFLFAAPVGILADKIGPTIPMILGSVFLLLALFMIALCKQYWQFFLAQGLLLGMGMIFPWGVIWPIVMDQFFLKTSLGFGWSIRIVAFMMIPLRAIAVLATRLPATSTKLKEGTQMETSEEGPMMDRSFLKQPPFILLCVGLALCSFGFFTSFFYTSSYAITRGMSQGLSFYTLATINAGSAFGKVLPGFVADRWGKFNILSCSAAAASIVAFCWTSATSTAGIFVWAGIYGFASGGILSLEIAAATSLAPKDKVSTALGVCFGSTALAQLFGPPISGQILTHGYTPVSIWCGAVLIAGFVALLAARLCLDHRVTARD
ncbi:hypothetical protein M409DRAFT_63791 [Zasmidium cellare ATCC 36951]|uniref:Major facilitator superfamily (MFS) profile domain-containing protein n=1 Tax=Zasmidium cellare ATCC 36951 TaxID=1080233 RepID=A0A6A6CWI9_ZASCE|nr:uncharacterized protein M409DRAFT_63791 [Zasmidium cellare ATCC 36951]KAF2171557.1 hypothetical protein M409DRAFT_63791 [Zasmidium cellare ATCC 36951]